MSDLVKCAELARCLYSAEMFLRDAKDAAPSDWQRDQVGKALTLVLDVNHDAIEHLAWKLRESA